MSNTFGSVDKYIDTKETFTALSGKYSVQKTYENIRKKNWEERRTAAQIKFIFYYTEVHFFM